MLPRLGALVSPCRHAHSRPAVCAISREGGRYGEAANDGSTLRKQISEINIFLGRYDDLRVAASIFKKGMPHPRSMRGEVETLEDGSSVAKARKLAARTVDGRRAALGRYGYLSGLLGVLGTGSA